MNLCHLSAIQEQSSPVISVPAEWNSSQHSGAAALAPAGLVLLEGEAVCCDEQLSFLPHAVSTQAAGYLPECSVHLSTSLSLPCIYFCSLLELSEASGLYRSPKCISWSRGAPAGNAVKQRRQLLGEYAQDGSWWKWLMWAVSKAVDAEVAPDELQEVWRDVTAVATGKIAVSEQLPHTGTREPAALPGVQGGNPDISRSSPCAELEQGVNAGG